MDDTGILDRLVPASDVFDLLARAYDQRGDFANFDVCKQAAIDMLVSRLRSGHATAWSTNCSIDSTLDTGSVTVNEIVSDWDFHRHRGFPAVIPLEFWAHFANAGRERRSFDRVSGDFHFSYTDGDYSCRDGSAFDVWLDPRGLPSAAVLTGQATHAAASGDPPARALPVPSGRGRPAANWWPAFAAELAIYIHEEGLPNGSETEGQGTIIDAVLSRLAERGAREPSRASIQPVVNDVLRRLRAARN
ncbi:hypothetical protein [Sphingomonas sp. Leaf343]|uniref:hypothetical protein n=1 Tax=Sphingomonas sp. Leaf343 TaxID=1736345 RepID=UPI000A9A0DF1|nr:hypothetical protein [Sphingomonas sp. Leaf343]